MSFPIQNIPKSFFPPLSEIPQPPKTLTCRGKLPSPDLKLITVVGSRRYTNYATHVIDHLITGLRGYPIGIVSGLALGVDSLAHKAALQNNLYTMAVPGSGIADPVIYPARHRPLAHSILQAGGCLLSEFAPTFKATKWSFTQRNRIMAGLSQATLVIEAAEQSGTLTTARMATDYNREVLVVPGDIFSSNSQGVHQFLKLGATPVTCAMDILEVLQINPEIEYAKHSTVTKSTDPQEQAVLDLLHEPTEKDELIRKLQLPTATAHSLLMKMEIAGSIISQANIYRKSLK